MNMRIERNGDWKPYITMHPTAWKCLGVVHYKDDWGEWSGALLQRESGAYYLASGVTLISLRKEDVQTELDKLNGE